MVTQVKGGYADVHTWENLLLAYRKAARGKRGRGPAAAFEHRLEDNLFQLQEELAPSGPGRRLPGHGRVVPKSRSDCLTPRLPSW